MKAGERSERAPSQLVVFCAQLEVHPRPSFNAAREGRCMMGNLKALCSILGTLLSLALVASPGVAQKKKKKAADDAPAAEASAEAEASGSGSLDSLMETAAEKKKDDKKKKKGKKGEEEPAAEAPAEEAPPAEEAVEEPDSWERPPVEEKAPPKELEPAPVEPSIEKPISVALLLGYGFMTDRRGNGADPYGFMAGLRGGYTFDFKLYAGLYYNYYLGSSKEGESQGTGLQSETTANYMHFGAEIGYDAELGPVQLRPSLQLGVALLVSDVEKPGTSDSYSDFMLAPGVTVVHPIDDFFIGGDFRGLIVTGDGASGITLAATGGIRF
jgi:hypothetical protein